MTSLQEIEKNHPIVDYNTTTTNTTTTTDNGNNTTNNENFNNDLANHNKILYDVLFPEEEIQNKANSASINPGAVRIKGFNSTNDSKSFSVDGYDDDEDNDGIENQEQNIENDEVAESEDDENNRPSMSPLSRLTTSARVITDEELESEVFEKIVRKGNVRPSLIFSMMEAIPIATVLSKQQEDTNQSSKLSSDSNNDHPTTEEECQKKNVTKHMTKLMKIILVIVILSLLIFIAVFTAVRVATNTPPTPTIGHNDSPPPGCPPDPGDTTTIFPPPGIPFPIPAYCKYNIRIPGNTQDGNGNKFNLFIVNDNHNVSTTTTENSNNSTDDPRSITNDDNNNITLVVGSYSIIYSDHKFINADDGGSSNSLLHLPPLP